MILKNINQYLLLCRVNCCRQETAAPKAAGPSSILAQSPRPAQLNAAQPQRQESGYQGIRLAKVDANGKLRLVASYPAGEGKLHRSELIYRLTYLDFCLRILMLWYDCADMKRTFLVLYYNIPNIVLLYWHWRLTHYKQIQGKGIHYTGCLKCRYMTSQLCPLFSLL